MSSIIQKLGITPEPWKESEHEDGEIIRQYTYYGSNGRAATMMDTVMTSSENARLIAAAPEMLYQLINIGLYGALKYESDWHKIQPILEKATGRTWDKIREIIDE